ncbi:hypothetical protein STEG23_033258, partial [Scotinomys teguina]
EQMPRFSGSELDPGPLVTLQKERTFGVGISFPMSALDCMFKVDKPFPLNSTTHSDDYGAYIVSNDKR